MTISERNQLAVEYSGLVDTVVSCGLPKLPWGWDYEDLLGWGMIALIEALDDYDPARSGNLVTYLRYRVRWGIIDALRSITHPRRKCSQPVFAFDHAAMYKVGSDETPQRVRGVLLREIWEASGALPPKLRGILKLRYGHGLTMRECGEELGMEEWGTEVLRRTAVNRLRVIVNDGTQHEHITRT